MNREECVKYLAEQEVLWATRNAPHNSSASTILSEVSLQLFVEHTLIEDILAEAKRILISKETT